MEEQKYTPEGHLILDQHFKDKFESYAGSVLDPYGFILYYQNGRVSRDDGPAFINTKKNSDHVHEAWYKDGEYHRLNGLAMIDDDPNWQRYAYKGKQFQKNQRDEWIKVCGHTKVKYLTDKLGDKTFTGSVINDEDDVLFLKKGEIHREDGPAVLYEDRIGYVKNGHYHKLDGPAIIRADGTKEYYIEDKRYATKEEWEAARDKYLKIKKILKHYGLDGVVEVKDVVENKDPNSRPTENFTGVTISEEDIVVFWKDGKHHRDNDEYCFYNDFDPGYAERTKRVNGELHSTTGPAWIEKKNRNKYYLNGVGFGPDKEAWEKAMDKKDVNDKIRKILDGNGLQNIDADDLRIVTTKKWNDPLRVNAKFTGIVVDTANEIVVFYKDGKQHREDGPAFINLIQKNNPFIKTAWRVEGKNHRLDGPAITQITHSKGDKYNEYWINDHYYSKSDFEEEIKNIETRKILDQYGLNDIQVDQVTRVEDWRNKHCNPDFTGIVLDNDGIVVFLKNGQKHRENGPCFFNDHHKENKYIQRAWRIDGKLHRTDGPAWIEDINDPKRCSYYLNGRRMEKDEWEKACEKFQDQSKEEKTMTETKKPKETITPEGHLKVKTWNSSFEGKETFTGSVIDDSGLVCYYKNGIEHREDGPSFINSKNNPTFIRECWCQNGRYHREDGPAWTDFVGDEHYYLDGISFRTKEDWEKGLRERGLGKPKKKVNPSTEAQEAAYRIARNELLKLVRGVLASQMIGTSRSQATKTSVDSFLSSELGGSVVLGAVGLLLPKLEDKLPPKVKPHLERLNKEFRVAGMASLGNNAANLVTDSMFGTSMVKILDKIPESSTTKETVVIVTELVGSGNNPYR